MNLPQCALTQRSRPLATQPLTKERLVIPEYVPGSGRVVWQVVGFASGRQADGHVEPLPLQGTVTFTPRVTEMRWPTAQDPFTAIASKVVAPVVDGVLRSPGWNDPSEPGGVFLVASEQPDAVPSSMQWEVSFQLENVVAQPVSRPFMVPNMGTVDLSTILPTLPAPAVERVVSTEERERAEEAAERAELAAERAENASLGDIDYDLILEQVEPLVDDVVGVALVPYATTAALTEGLATKQPVGDYATTTALTSGLAGKQPVGDYATTADLGAYATTAYVDQTVGDIDTVLSGILGGE